MTQQNINTASLNYKRSKNARSLQVIQRYERNPVYPLTPWDNTGKGDEEEIMSVIKSWYKI